MRRLHNRGGDLAVVRRDNQDIHALRQKVVTLFRLHCIIAVRDLHFALGADFFAALFNRSFIALPALFFQRVHRKADAHGTRAFDFLASAFGSLHTRSEKKRQQ